MGRWPVDARARLQEAALALFLERGYAATTVDDVAARAGVSARTFFRHFRDKEEVLFGADDQLSAALLDAARGAPAGARPAQVVLAALVALAGELEPQREQLRSRARVLAGEVALQGRELAKQAAWAAALRDVLVERGCPAVTADLLAGAGATVYRTAATGWLTDPGPAPLAHRLQASWNALTAALVEG